MECIQGCQMFLSGGSGIPSTNERGECSCACGDEESWSEYNILGRASCVPKKAHLIYGALGLLASVASLCHAMHQFNRQVKSHARHLAASTSPIEQCRRHLHVITVVHALISMFYFSLVLILQDNKLWGSAILISGIAQFTANIGGMLAMRMWIYMNDPRLLQQSPGVLAISNALEKPTGQYVAYSAVCTGAVIATALAAARWAEAAIKVASVALVIHVLFAGVLIWKCGMYLLRTVNRSLHNHDAVAAQGRGGSLDLFAAKKKLKIAMAFGEVVSMQTMTIVLFAVISKRGSEEALIWFGIPMGFAPLVWFGFNIQLHAGRSTPRFSQGLTSAVTSQPHQTSKFGELKSKFEIALSRNQRSVVPTDEFTPGSP